MLGFLGNDLMLLKPRKDDGPSLDRRLLTEIIPLETGMFLRGRFNGSLIGYARAEIKDA